eukprot:9791914-Heterocapsa_arctica.AAC.1
MKNHTDHLLKEIQPVLGNIHERLESIESSVFGQKEMTKIGLKYIENCMYEETGYIRDKIKDIGMTTDRAPDVAE